MKNTFFQGGVFNQQGNSNALLYVKNIDIFAAIGRGFFFLALPCKSKNIIGQRCSLNFVASL